MHLSPCLAATSQGQQPATSLAGAMEKWHVAGPEGCLKDCQGTDLSAGIWNAHTSVGNILGSAVAAACLSWGWGWAFLIPGAALAFTGIIIWLFLVVEPEEAGLMKMKDSLVVSLPPLETVGRLQNAGDVPAAVLVLLHELSPDKA